VAMWAWGLCVMLVTPCGRENTGGTADALPVKCREPAAHATRHRRDHSRFQLRDTVGLVVILSYLIQSGMAYARSYNEWRSIPD
jgi:hypothetical protein